MLQVQQSINIGINMDRWDGRTCIIDGRAYNGLKTIKNEQNRIILDSGSLHFSSDFPLIKPNKTESEQKETKCTWVFYTQYPAEGNGFTYNLKINKFQIDGCNSCACGSLNIYEYAGNNDIVWVPGEGWRRKREGKRLLRVCGSKTPTNLELESKTEMVIKFQSNSTKSKNIDIQYSTTHRSGSYYKLYLLMQDDVRLIVVKNFYNF